MNRQVSKRRGAKPNYDSALVTQRRTILSLTPYTSDVLYDALECLWLERTNWIRGLVGSAESYKGLSAERKLKLTEWRKSATKALLLMRFLEECEEV